MISLRRIFYLSQPLTVKRHLPDNNIAIIAEALECSLNKTFAKHSLWIEFEESDLDNKENTKMIYFDFAFGNISNFK